jgi:hypothetical protein
MEIILGMETLKDWKMKIDFEKKLQRLERKN